MMFGIFLIYFKGKNVVLIIIKSISLNKDGMTVLSLNGVITFKSGDDVHDGVMCRFWDSYA